MAGRLEEWFAEAKRRRVFRTTGVYLVGVWAISQGAVELAPLFGAPDWLLRALLIAAVAFAPGVVVLAWMFDIGRTGIVRDPKDAALAEAERNLSEMPTQLGTDSGRGAVIVRWMEEDGERAVLFADEFLIGRSSECGVRFYDPLVSRKHARVHLEDGSWMIRDLGSRNGTVVNDEKVESIALGIASDVRVNAAGPSLRLEVLAPGQETMAAMERLAGAEAVAHVRLPGPERALRPSTGAMRS